MIKNNLNKNLFKIISIVTIALSMSFMAFSFTAFAITVAPSTEPKPITTINFDVKGEGAAAGNKVELTFDSGEKFTSTVKADLTYSIAIVYPHIKGRMEVVEFEGATTVVANTIEYPYNITAFNLDKTGKVLGPVIFSGSGVTPLSEVTVEFPNGESIKVIADKDGKYNASPTFPSIAGDITATEVGKVAQTIPYDGGITTVSATQVVTPPVVVVPPVVTPVTPPVVTNPAGTTTPVAAKAVPAKATVRSGGFLQIAGIIALFTVILAILVINKKFKI
jgi:hypothetical protein